MGFKSGWGISDAVNGIVAIGTLVMAWLSYLMIRETRKSIKASERSARATEESVERMKDGVMPYLALDIADSADGIALHVRNVGSGLAKIRQVTVRTDVKIESVLEQPISYWDCHSDDPELIKGKARILDFVLSADDEYTFLLSSGHEFSPGEQHDYLSSLSIFYEDVYKRLYRSRLLFKHRNWNGQYALRKFATEHFKVDSLPVPPMSNFDIDYLRLPEGHAPHVYQPSYGMFSLIENCTRFIGSCVSGDAFTQGKDVQVENIVIPWHGYPEFHLRIDNYVPFALIIVPNNGTSQITYDIKNVPGSGELLRGVPVQRETLPFSQYGLKLEGRGDQEIKELYGRVYKTFLNNEIH